MMRIRAFEESDLPTYLAIQSEEWDESMASTEAKLRSRFETFPEGMISALGPNGEVVGCATLIRVDGYDVEDGLSWEDLSDNGWCTTHNPEGDIFFGVDVSMSRRAPRSAVYFGYLEIMRLCIEHNTRGLVFGGRMPRYHKYADRMTPQEYLGAKNSRGRYIDPEIEIYSRLPGVETLGVVEEYFKDWQSLNCGVMLLWNNPLHNRPVPRKVQERVVSHLASKSKRDRQRAAKKRPT